MALMASHLNLSGDPEGHLLLSAYCSSSECDVRNKKKWPEKHPPLGEKLVRATDDAEPLGTAIFFLRLSPLHES